MYTLKKSLGQHFLHDENICKKIVETIEINPGENLLEVGPGGGALTKYLLPIEHINFKAVELDEEKIAFLINTYPSIKDKIIHQNFLDMALPFNGRFHIAGNFPYNISTQIVFKILSWRPHVQEVVGMFQKEVAQRIAAKEGSKIYGILSVLTQAFFDVEYLFDVGEKCFTPPPKVKSGVLKFSPKKQFPDMRSESDFFLVVKTAFNQRRKMLRNALKPLFSDTILQEPIFEKRAEQLTVNDFANLTFKLTEKQKATQPF